MHTSGAKSSVMKKNWRTRDAWPGRELIEKDNRESLIARELLHGMSLALSWVVPQPARKYYRDSFQLKGRSFWQLESS